MELKGKKFLITQPMMHWICGSTVVTLELAEYLQAQGADVVVYTCFYGEPTKSICKKRCIQVQVSDDALEYRLQDFDYIWVHSQVIPPSILKELSKKIPAKMPAFIFLHMSAMDWIPDEKPWIYDLENRLSSKSLFISEEVFNVNRSILNANIETAFFRNPAPTTFSKRSYSPASTLKNLLIVSNHPPKEVLDAKQILEEEYNVRVDILGEKQEKYQLLNIDILERYDAVITIAKTVPYCLVSGTPVYVYDEFAGGVGWLNSKNFKKAQKRNFSGYQNRFYKKCYGGGFVKKTARQIVAEIVKEYPQALKYHGEKQHEFQREFLLKNKLPNIIKSITVRKDIECLSADYTESVLASQQFADRHFKYASILHLANQNNMDLQNQNAKLQEALQARSYQLLQKILKPYSIIAKKMKEK